MEKLRVYQKALQLAAEVYFFIRNNPVIAKDYSLADQLKRAAVSIVANIAEGYCRSKKQYQNYLQIASGSSNEVIALLQIIALIYKVDTTLLQAEFRSLGKQINAFSHNLQS